MRPGVVRDGALLAVGTLSVLRVPPPARVDRAAGGVAMALAPVVGVLVALPAAGLAELARLAGAGDLVAAALAVAALALATGGLHLDGLADTVDGLSASRGDRDRALEVMRRGDVGPLGAAALVLVLLVQVTALARALPQAGPAALLVAAAAARTVLPVLCARGVPAARPGGLGATVAGSVPRAVAALALLATAGAATLPEGLRGAAAVVAGCLGGALLGARAVRRLGGVTGDVLGAAVEAGTAAALVVLGLQP